MKCKTFRILIVGLGLFAATSIVSGDPVGTAFTYQGQLEDNGALANGTYDFRFVLYDDSELGSPVGSPVYKDNVVVEYGLFTVMLNEKGEFGATAFNGSPRWLEVGVRPWDSTGVYETILPRHPLTPTPYAIKDDDTLGGLSCTDGEVAKSNGTDWECGSDETESYWTQVGDDIFYTAGNVGIGTTDLFFLPIGDSIRIMNATLPNGSGFLACAADPNGTGKIYCFGGDTGGGILDEIVEYDPSADTALPVSARFDTPRSSLACAPSPDTGKIYCFGGGNAGGPQLDEILEYDPANRDQDPVLVATLPSIRARLACATDPTSGFIYCFGGHNDFEGFLGEIVEFKPTTYAVRTTSATFAPRGDCACAASVTTEKIYCFGGEGGSGSLKEVFEYDPANPDQDPVIMAAMLPVERDRLACAADLGAGKIYCFGGAEGQTNFVDQIVEYDPPPVDKINVMSATLPSARRYLACATNPATWLIYCFGAYNEPSVVLDEIVEYRGVTREATLQVGEPGDGTGAVANAWSVFSSRAFKQDISPLGRADYQNILDKLKVTDVVRYRFAGDMRRTLHLGVIAEDSPAEILSPGGKAVSLGDYTAFLMAAIKSQQAVIEEQGRLIADVQARLQRVEATLSEPVCSEERGGP